MAHYAKILNGIVQKVIVAEQEFFNSFVDDSAGEWIQTSYNTLHNQHPNNTPLRGNFAGIGYIYDATNDVFYPPQPFKSWMLNKTTWTWDAPVPMPEDDKFYTWDEDTTNWVEVTE